MSQPASHPIADSAAVATMETAAVQAQLQRIGSTVVAPERRSSEYLQKFVEGEIAR